MKKFTILLIAIVLIGNSQAANLYESEAFELIKGLGKCNIAEDEKVTDHFRDISFKCENGNFKITTQHSYIFRIWINVKKDSGYDYFHWCEVNGWWSAWHLDEYEIRSDIANGQAGRQYAAKIWEKFKKENSIGK